MTQYITRDGDMLDKICLNFYGKTEGMVEEVLKVNRELADIGEVLPSGIFIWLPEVDNKDNTSESSSAVKLWD